MMGSSAPPWHDVRRSSRSRWLRPALRYYDFPGRRGGVMFLTRSLHFNYPPSLNLHIETYHQYPPKGQEVWCCLCLLCVPCHCEVSNRCGQSSRARNSQRASAALPCPALPCAALTAS
ncbi:hypothetical protein E2C01_003309 [Portunus trituberculatus]|uniref:Uncharacterized protein n=1 Tax=Portunus trituberculatus TaxID=210409 RepID=A0A5B7CMJ2_PORTR|nr:hypothetical protein [Portunus trituberculatus]